MNSESYEDWVSIYNEDINSAWQEERLELRKVSMLYCAFQNELNRLKSSLNDQLTQVKLELKRKERLEKCKKFVGLVQSERFDDIVETDKENKTPGFAPLKEFDLNETKTDVIIESPNTNIFMKNLPSTNKSAIATSPVLRKNSFKSKRKTTSSPALFPNLNLKVNKTPKVNESGSDNRTPKICDDSNIMECSIIEDTPDLKPAKRAKRSRLQSRKKSLNKSKQATTLTQMFFEPKKQNKHIDSNLPSMTVTEMINLINESSDSETEAELDQSDATVDDLDMPRPTNPENPETVPQPKNDEKISDKKDSPELIYEEVVRGKERKKLKGWSCQDCQDYYEGLNLPPEELQKKKDACSKHRFRFKPREDTYDGFWDLTFGPTPPTQNSESLMLNYKK